jgi:hypothetical protein
VLPEHPLVVRPRLERLPALPIHFDLLRQEVVPMQLLVLVVLVEIVVALEELVVPTAVVATAGVLELRGPTSSELAVLPSQQKPAA